MSEVFPKYIFRTTPDQNRWACRISAVITVNVLITNFYRRVVVYAVRTLALRLHTPPIVPYQMNSIKHSSYRHLSATFHPIIFHYLIIDCIKASNSHSFRFQEVNTNVSFVTLRNIWKNMDAVVRSTHYFWRIHSQFISCLCNPHTLADFEHTSKFKDERSNEQFL